MSDFTYVADKVLEEQIGYKTLVSQFENGTEQRRKKWSLPLREWNLTFENRTFEEMEDVQEFFEGKFGMLSAFTWTNPNDDEEYTVRFKEDTFAFRRKGYNLYDYSVSFIEVK